MRISVADMLRIDDIHTYLGDSHILQGISLGVAADECVAILGRNGAGKTTTLRTIVGLARARAGCVQFKGRDVTNEPTFRIARSGIAFVPEDRGIFPSVTIDEHLAIAFGAARNRAARKPAEYVYGLFPRLRQRRHSPGGQLSGGEQQMLAIGRALISGPDLLILDEPSEGLAPIVIDRLEEVLLNIKNSGTPILLVEQNYHLAMRLADRVYVLSQGRIQFQGTTTELVDNEAVRQTYLSV